MVQILKVSKGVQGKQPWRKGVLAILGFVSLIIVSINSIPKAPIGKDDRIVRYKQFESNPTTAEEIAVVPEVVAPISEESKSKASTSEGSKFDLDSTEKLEISTNREKVESFLKLYADTCKEKSSIEEMASFVSDSLNKNDDEESASSTMGIKRCKNVFIDFGSNIGDSVGKFMDSSLLDCMKDDKGVRYDVTDREFISGKHNKITSRFKSVANASGQKTTDFCVYGVEGNPVFTDRLKKMEQNVMSMSPRLVQNVHMLTEHVGMGVDGPTKLYLDTVNEKDNFWGSSVLQSHQDVQKSATESSISYANVTGITLTTLMDQTLLAFSPTAKPEDTKGGHLIVKVDIEGGEYDLMDEVAESLKLCELKAMGNEVDLIVEYHYMSITDINERGPRVQKKDKVKEKLNDCGVTVQRMNANWN